MMVDGGGEAVVHLTVDRAEIVDHAPRRIRHVGGVRHQRQRRVVDVGTVGGMRDRREQRDLTARRTAREEQIVGVGMVLRGVGAHEPHGIARVLDLRGERCNARMPVFHDRDDEAALRDAAERGDECRSVLLHPGGSLHVHHARVGGGVGLVAGLRDEDLQVQGRGSGGCVGYVGMVCHADLVAGGGDTRRSGDRLVEGWKIGVFPRFDVHDAPSLRMMNADRCAPSL